MTRSYPNLVNCSIKVLDRKDALIAVSSSSSSLMTPSEELPNEYKDLLNKPKFTLYDFKLGMMIQNKKIQLNPVYTLFVVID